jgi:hypothetical protein
MAKTSSTLRPEFAIQPVAVAATKCTARPCRGKSDGRQLDPEQPERYELSAPMSRSPDFVAEALGASGSPQRLKAKECNQRDDWKRHPPAAPECPGLRRVVAGPGVNQHAWHLRPSMTEVVSYADRDRIVALTITMRFLISSSQLS